MNQSEIDRLQILLNDEFLLQIINKVFTQTVKEAEPKVSEVNDDLQLGQKYRAYEKAKEILSDGFIKLLEFKKVGETKDKLNLAR